MFRWGNQHFENISVIENKGKYKMSPVIEHWFPGSCKGTKARGIWGEGRKKEQKTSCEIKKELIIVMTKFEVVYKQEMSLVSMVYGSRYIWSWINLQALICMSYTYPPPQSANVQMTSALILHINQGQRFTQWRQCILNQSLQAKSFWLFQTLHFLLLLAQYHFNLSWNP